MPVGDGTLGVLEGHSSKILLDGSQPARWWIRADCVGETAMVLALANQQKVAANLVDFLVRSKMANGSRLDPASVSYGLLGWNEATKYYKNEDGYDVYYGDDNGNYRRNALAASSVARDPGRFSLSRDFGPPEIAIRPGALGAGRLAALSQFAHGSSRYELSGVSLGLVPLGLCEDRLSTFLGSLRERNSPERGGVSQSMEMVK
jgi:hypothetical protein